MSIKYWEKSEYKTLEKISIEEIGLSDEAVRIISRTGVTRVSDCIDHFMRGIDALSLPDIEFLNVMDGEVTKKFKEIGYWQFYEENRFLDT